MTYRPYLKSVMSRANHQTFGQAGTGKQTPRRESLHNRTAPRVSAACQRNEHTSCFSLNCTCVKCGHKTGSAA